MRALVVYDSYFGNTERIAQAIGQALAATQPVEVLGAGEVIPAKLQGIELLIVGSPTRGFRPTEGVSKLLQTLGARDLVGVKVAAFDTRIALNTIRSGVLRFVVKSGGFAAANIAKTLRNKGGELCAPPEGFTVEGEQGPLTPGELERAREWARQVAAAVATPV